MGFSLFFSDVEGCAAASSVGNKDGYIVGCSDNDGDGGGVSPLFLLVLRSENKQRKNTSDGDGLFFSPWCRSGGCGSDDDTCDNSNGQLGGGAFFLSIF